jgi:hypothetical protein
MASRYTDRKAMRFRGRVAATGLSSAPMERCFFSAQGRMTATVRSKVHGQAPGTDRWSYREAPRLRRNDGRSSSVTTLCCGCAVSR